MDLATASCLNCADYEQLAAERLEPGALAYYAGGAGDEHTLRENTAAWSRRRLRPRVLVDVSDVTTATTVLGTPVPDPVLVAPTALPAHGPPRRRARHGARGGGGRDDLVLSTLATSNARARSPRRRRERRAGTSSTSQRNRSVSQALIDAAVDAGFTAIVVTVDAPVPGRRERDLRTAFSVPMDLTMPGRQPPRSGAARASRSRTSSR